jgi:hypothetical protein
VCDRLYVVNNEDSLITAYKQQMHNIFNTILSKNTCFDASSHHLQGDLAFSFGVTEVLPEDDALRHRNM